jgi:hypothetical protein
MPTPARRISHLTGEVKRLGEELRAVQAEAEAARALAARWEADATALHAEKLEVGGMLLGQKPHGCAAGGICKPHAHHKRLNVPQPASANALRRPRHLS